MIPVLATVELALRAIIALCEFLSTPEGQAAAREMREHRAELREWIRGVIAKPDPFADLRRLFLG